MQRSANVFPALARSTAQTFRQRAWASVTGPAMAKEDPGTDIQEDSSASKAALEDSKKKAEGAEGVTRGKSGDKDVLADPEVSKEAKEGAGFPHQTKEDRQANLASSTQGEAPVKTREYTPKPGSKLYPDENPDEK